MTETITTQRGQSHTMNEAIFNCLASAGCKLSTREVYLRLSSYTYRSVQTALYRLTKFAAALESERDGREFLYWIKADAKAPVDGRGGDRRK